MSNAFRMTLHGNELLEGEGFFVSYRAKPSSDPITTFTTIWAISEDEDGEYTRTDGETALVTTEIGRNRYRILDGDYRRNYEALAPLGLQACLDFFNEQRALHGSDWSTELEDRRLRTESELVQ